MKPRDQNHQEFQQEAIPNAIKPAKRLLSACPKPPVMQQSLNNCRKTRDLPNLSQCHACGFRVDVCNGKNEIEVLYSEWRIVLLCKKCLVLVESSKACSYCFEEAAENCFCCSGCRRSIHRDCFLSYKTVTPWSYPCSGAEFLVCVDCWVPKAIENRRAISRDKRCKTVLDSTNSMGFESGNARVLDDEHCAKSMEGVVKDANSIVQTKVKVAERAREVALRKVVVALKAVELESNARALDDRDCAKSMEDVVKDVNSIVETKVKVAERAREVAMKKVVVALKAVEFASSALDLIAKKDLDGSVNGCDCDGKVDDVELAFQLHRTMNSSPRISKNFCPVNSGCMVAMMTKDENAGACQKQEIDVDRSASGHPDCVRIRDGGSSSYRDYLKSLRLVYVRRKRMAGKCCDMPDHEDVKANSIEGNGSCSNKLLNTSIADESMNLESQIYCKQDDCNPPMNARCNGKSDRFFLKYRRKSGDRCFIKYKRKSGCRSISNGKRKFLYEGSYHQIQSSDHRIQSSDHEFLQIPQENL